MSSSDRPVSAEQRAKEILRKALARIRTTGWCQGDFEDDDLKCCALGAINRSSDPSNDGDTELAKDLLARAVGTTRNDLMRWNDSRGRTEMEVIKAFERAVI